MMKHPARDDELCAGADRVAHLVAIYLAAHELHVLVSACDRATPSTLEPRLAPIDGDDPREERRDGLEQGSVAGTGVDGEAVPGQSAAEREEIRRQIPRLRLGVAMLHRKVLAPAS